MAGWLHRCALLESAHLLRARRREAAHRVRLADELKLSALEVDPWKEVAGVIDEALQELPPSDREVILAKYYEGLSYREIAVRQAKKEAATRKQGSRALEKLERLLCRKGVVVSGAVLASGLESELTEACPVGLVDMIEGRVGELASGQGLAWSASLSTILASPFVLVIVAAVMALLPVASGWGRRQEVVVIGGVVSKSYSVLSARRASNVDTLVLPTIDDILAARGTEQLALLIQWLPHADDVAISLLGEALRHEIGSYVSKTHIERLWPLVLQRWLKLAPDEALSYIEDLRSQQPRLGQIFSDENVYGLWAQVDPDEALAAAGDSLLAVNVLKRLQETDPQRALAMVDTLDSEVRAYLSWEGVFEKLARKDVEGALEKARDLPSELNMRDEALAGVVKQLAKNEPERALNLARELIGGDGKQAVIEGIVKVWLGGDPAAASQVISEWDAEGQRNRLAKMAGMIWSREDPEASVAWMEGLADPAMKRAAQSGLVVTFSGSDIERAVTSSESQEELGVVSGVRSVSQS